VLEGGARSGLLRVWGRAKELGFLGPVAVEDHLQHAEAYARAVGPDLDGLALDLGSGGGVPGLALALHWPESRWILVDRADRRTAFLEAAVQELALGARVQVRSGAAEMVARDPELRGQVDLVVARSFGPPATVAECGAPLLGRGGRLVVSEPPTPDASRWPAHGLAELGLRLLAGPASSSPVVVLGADGSCPAGYPRRPGKPAKSPLW